VGFVSEAAQRETFPVRVMCDVTAVSREKGEVWLWCVPGATPRRKISETCSFWNYPHCSPSADMGQLLAGIGLVLAGGARQAQRVDQFRVRWELIGVPAVCLTVCLDNLAESTCGSLGEAGNRLLH
jgi:hypothetical protein